MALSSPTMQAGTVYTVATGHSTSLNQILDELERTAPNRFRKQYAPARAGDILHSSGSSTRLQACGWTPQVTLQAGISELLA